jgi:hypothetical protein
MIPFLAFKESKVSYEPLSELENEDLKRPLTLAQYRSLSHLLSFLAGCLLVLLGGFAYRIFVNAEVQQAFSPIPSSKFYAELLTQRLGF